MSGKNILLIKNQITEILLVVVSSIILGILYNFRTIESEFIICLNGHSTIIATVFLLKILVAISMTILVFLIFSFSKVLLKFFLMLFFFISTLYLYILNKFGTILDGAMIANAIESFGHVGEVLDYSIAIYFLSFFLLPAFLIIRVEIVKTSIRKKILHGLFCLAIIGFAESVFASEKIVTGVFTQYSPANYWGSIYEYFDRFHSQMKQSQSRYDLNKIYKFQREKEVKDLNVVLIIGESLRADHLALNGYERNTTPSLSSTPNLLNFTISAAFGTTTKSVTSMLSHRTKADFIDIPPEKSIVSVFKNSGFKTYWYSAQSSKEFINGMLNIMASEADDYFFRDRLQASLKTSKVYDEALIPYLRKAVGNGGENFIVLHSFGNHIKFHERYPDNFRIFSPECRSLPSSCKRSDLINSYDNSVVHTDYFVSQVIESLRGTNSILFFAADHGAFLGENGVYANGGSEETGDSIKKVPMFFYMTDALREDKFFREKFSAAMKKTAFKNLSHDNLFDSILDCSGINSELFARDLSICRNWIE